MANEHNPTYPFIVSKPVAYDRPNHRRAYQAGWWDAEEGCELRADYSDDPEMQIRYELGRQLYFECRGLGLCPRTLDEAFMLSTHYGGCRLSAVRNTLLRMSMRAGSR